MIKIQAIPVRSDNYAWLLHETENAVTAVIDPGEPGRIIEAVEAAGGKLDIILLTHHHADHVDGTEELRARYGARVIGPAAESARMPAFDQAVRDGDTVTLGAVTGTVLATPGHTSGHIAYYFPDPPALFCGDTLFSLGCGRLFEGSAEDMFHSLRRFDSLSSETLVCCGHEYTESNARFAVHVDPDNQALQQRAAEISVLRKAGYPTIPSTLASERACNPFLRAPDALALGKLRKEKDSF